MTMSNLTSMRLRPGMSLPALLIVTLTAARASATPLVPGGSVSVSGTNYPATIVQDVDRSISLFGSGALDPIATVTVRDRVTRLPAGTYNFERYLLNNTNFTMARMNYAESGFTGFTTDVDHDPTGGGTSHPGTVTRSTLPGDVVTFSNFTSDTLTGGQRTDYLTVKTDAPSYALTGTISLDLALSGNRVTGSVPAFGPALPEPSAMGLFALSAMALLRRRRCGPQPARD